MSSRECKSTRASVTVAVTIAILLASAVAQAASGGAPLTIAHSGYLLDGADAPLSIANLSMKFRIYAQSTGSGTAQWEGTCATVQVVRGYYTVLLGSTACPGTMADPNTTLDTSDLPTTGERWLEVEVGGVTMSPRMAIATVPTAAVASRALMADSLGVEACDVGYIPVPATALPGGRVVPGFCVMKYEAKNNGSGVMSVVASDMPWVSITWTAAKAECVTAGKHLITEDEWLAIANNVANVDSNWTGEAVGGYLGKLFSGHNDNVSGNVALAASTNDNDGYIGTGNTTGDGINQRRTLALSNGKVIWDLAGNVWEWTDATIASASRYHGGASGWKTYNEADDVNTVATKVPLAKRPPSPWNATQGMGSYFDGSGAMGGGAAFRRGGSWGYATDAGVFTLGLDRGLADSDGRVGFRCAGP